MNGSSERFDLSLPNMAKGSSRTSKTEELRKWEENCGENFSIEVVQEGEVLLLLLLLPEYYFILAYETH